MKIEKIRNINYYIVIIITVLLVMLTGCNNKNDDISNKLEAPQNLTLTKDEYLKWDKVESAKGYTVTIQQINLDTKTYDVKNNEFDIFELLDEVGEYNLSVIAYNDSAKSAMSNVINYQIKDQSDQFDYVLKNNSYYRAVPKKDAILEGKLVFPKEYNGLPVNEIDHIKECHNITGAIYSDIVTMGLGFKKCNNIRRIKFSPNMDTIYSGSFLDCINIKELILPDGIENLFGDSIYNLSSLKTIKFSKTVKSIGNPLFKECYELENIEIPEDNPYYKSINNHIIEKANERIVYGNPYYEIPECAKIIGRNAYVAFSSLNEITIPGNIKRIENYAFVNTNYRKIVIEEGVEEIISAFKNNTHLEEIYLPSTLKNLSYDNFNNSPSLKKIVFPNGNDKYRVEGNCLIDNETKTLQTGFGQTVVIPSDIKIIGNSAFLRSIITEINIPSNIEKIEYGAFRECVKLTKVTFEEGIKEIGAWAFAESFHIKSINIPKSVKIIGTAAFYQCFCPIILHNTFDSISSNGAFECTSVYTDITYDEFSEKYYSVSVGTGEFGRASLCLNCTFVDDYLYSYQYIEEQLTERTKRKNYQLHGYMDDGWLQLDITDIIEVPYREGYEFMGFSFEKDSDNVDVEVEYRRHIYNDYATESYMTVVTRYCYSIKFPKNLQNGQILYAIWKKI